MDQLHSSRVLGVDAHLTGRERVVLREIVDGVTLDEVASRLFVSRNTVKTQLRSAYRKIGVATRAEAIAWVRARSVPAGGPTDGSPPGSPRTV